MLGKGQAEITGKKDISYKKANYFLPGNSENYCTTPFLGYALCKLIPEFDVIHILGTQNSLWTEFLFFLIDKSDDSEELSFLEELLKNKNSNEFLSTNEELIIKYQKILKKYLGVKVNIHIIPIGKNDEELWKIFDVIATIPKNGDVISLDITHGLRYQPFLVTLAFNYFKNIRKNVTLKNVYYGALELTEHFNNLTPVFKLNNLLTLSEWIDAVKSFSDYGDIRALNHLLKSEQNLRDKINQFSYNLALNGAKNIRKSALELVNAIEEINYDNLELVPLKFVKDELVKFPYEISQIEEDWQLFIYLAERNWKNSQFALSILEAHQAILARVGQLMGVNAFCRKKKESDVVAMKARKIKKIEKLINKINDYRNLTAHSDLGFDINIEELIQKYPGLLKQLKTELGNLGEKDLIKNKTNKKEI
jgi:CRISPR-associated Csx2 family protein